MYAAREIGCWWMGLHNAYAEPHDKQWSDDFYGCDLDGHNRPTGIVGLLQEDRCIRAVLENGQLEVCNTEGKQRQSHRPRVLCGIDFHISRVNEILENLS